MGHLLGALRSGDEQAIEKEILHVAGPLLECWNAAKTRVEDVHVYKCMRCKATFTLAASNSPMMCPLCEAMLETLN